MKDFSKDVEKYKESRNMSEKADKSDTEENLLLIP